MIIGLKYPKVRSSAMDQASFILRLLTAIFLITLSPTASTVISQNETQETEKTTKDNRTNTESFRMSPARGTWSPWTPWAPCSRSCGGGVAVQTRTCVPPNADNRSRGGRKRRRLLSPTHTEFQKQKHNRWAASYADLGIDKKPVCEGRENRYHECNTLACPGPVRDFRAEQCSAFNKRPFQGKYLVWMPYIDSKNPCLLNCRPAGRKFYATLATAVDGTSCDKPGFRALCVQGECKAVGLDGVVSQWSGPGTGSYRCGSRLVSGIFTRVQLPLGYTSVATLPAGSCHINITELHHSNNFLALKTTNGSFIINGNFAISWSGEYEAAGTKFLYRRQGGNLVESISAPGPLLQSVDVMILYQHPNQGIKYEYTTQVSPDEDQKVPNPAPAPPLLFPSKPFNTSTHRSSSYHHHHRTRPEMDENAIIPYDTIQPKENIPEVDSNAIEPKRPDERFPYGAGVLATESEKPANGAPHPSQRHRRRKFIWQILGYTPCSRSCAGTQNRTLGCVREYNHAQVSDKRCGPKPANTIRSCGGSCQPRWVTAQWGPCSATCGPAIQNRQIQCRQDISHQALNVKVSDTLCTDTPPATTQRCQLPECVDPNDIQVDTNEISNRRRTELSPDYNRYNVETRTNPRNRNFRVKNDTDRFTDSANIPVLTRYGNETFQTKSHSRIDDLNNDISGGSDGRDKNYRNNVHWKAGNAWMYSDWTQECTEECGKGLQTRSVKCADPSGCDERRRPLDSRACASDKKCITHSVKWFTGPWSQCSNPCAINGKMTREVVCVSYYKGQHRINNAGCPQHTKPESERPCPPSMLRGDCPPEWFISDWSQCLGQCGSTQQTRLVTCQSSSGGNEAICTAPRPANRRDCVPSHCHQSGLTTSRTISKNGNENDNSLTVNQPNNGECVDKISTCHVAVQARLCQYEFYAISCCAACRKAPIIS